MMKYESFISATDLKVRVTLEDSNKALFFLNLADGEQAYKQITTKVINIFIS